MASTLTSRIFPGFNSIFKISSTGSSYYFRASLKLTEDEFKVTRGEISIVGPVFAEWFMGRKKPGDIVRTGYVSPILISDRVRKLFLDHNFTGWSTYEVALHGKKGEPIPGFSGLVINGRCGPINDDHSQRVSKQFPKKITHLLKGMYFDPNSWDGSDFFMPEGDNGLRFVTQQVKETFEKEKIKNIVFTSLDEVERDII